MARFVKRGDVYIVNLGNPYGTEQGGNRPCIIVSNQKCCAFSDLVYIAPITSQIKSDIPEHYILYQSEFPFLDYPINTVLGEQTKPVDKMRLNNKIGEIPTNILSQIIDRIKINF